MDHIDQAFIGRAGLRLEMFKQKAHGRWNFRCPICGDSAKNKYKSRAWFIGHQGKTFFKCFNDDTCGSSFGYFLKRFDQALYSEWSLEKFREYGNGKRQNSIAEDVIEKLPGDPAHVHDLPKISSLPKDHFARVYIEDRKLPTHWLDRLYFCEKWKELTNQFEPDTYKTIKPNGDEPRIVIPAYNEKRELICFQGRSLDPDVDEKKYLTVKVKDCLKLWGMDNVKRDKPVFLLEGAFDAMCLSNTAAVLGGTANPADLPNGYDWVFALDNEPRNVSVLRRYQQLIDRKAKFVNWRHWKFPGKDVNKCIQNGISAREIQRYFESNIVTGLHAQLEFDKWKKVPL